eukprot:gene870-1363_t
MSAQPLKKLKKPRKIWLDTDAGIDDAQALMLLLSAADVEIVGISCVVGNVSVDKVTKNVSRILEACGRSELPLYIGASENLLGTPVECDFHGEDGLGDAGTCEPSAGTVVPIPGPAAMHLVQAVNEAPQEIAVVAIGPLTNLALACRLDSNFATRVGSVFVMGGAETGKGNISITGEYNFYFDPEAAKICLSCFSMMTLVTWECALQHEFSWQGIIAKWSASAQTNNEAFVPCDPLLAAVAIDPTLIQESKTVHMLVELQGLHTRGQSVIDWLSSKKKPPNVKMVTRVDIERFCHMMNRSTDD